MFNLINLTYPRHWIVIVLLASTSFGCDSSLKPFSSIETAAKGSYSGAISPNGQLALVGSIHHGASLWNIADNARLFSWNHQPNVPLTTTSSDFSYDSQLAVTVEQYTLVLWDTKTGEGIRHWRTPAKVLDAKLSERGQYALLGLEDNRAVLFDIQKGGIVREFHHTDSVNSVSMSPNGQQALTGSDDNSAVIWDLSSGTQRHFLPHDDNVTLTALSNDGKWAYTMSQYDKAALWDTQTGEMRGSLKLKAQSLKRGLRHTAAIFSDDSQLLLTGRPDQTVELWNTQSLTRIAKWTLPKRDKWKPTGAAIQALGFTSNTQFIALASNGFVHVLKLPE